MDGVAEVAVDADGKLGVGVISIADPRVTLLQ